jgi:hypothetical protein
LKRKADISGYEEETSMASVDQTRDLPSGRFILSRGWIMVTLALVAWAVVLVSVYLVYRGIAG